MEKVSIEKVNSKKIVKEVYFRPKTEIIVVMIIGIALLIFNNLWSRIFGVVLIGIASAVIYLVKDRKVLTIADDALYVYLEDGSINEIKFDEIDEWGCNANNNGPGSLLVSLNNQQMIKVTTYQVEKIRTTLTRLLLSKETYEKAKQARINPNGWYMRLKRKFSKKK